MVFPFLEGSWASMWRLGFRVQGLRPRWGCRNISNCKTESLRTICPQISTLLLWEAAIHVVADSLVGQTVIQPARAISVKGQKFQAFGPRG